MKIALKTIAFGLLLLVVGLATFSLAYWWSGTAWHDTPVPLSESATEMGPGPYAVFQSINEAKASPRLDLRRATAADTPLQIYSTYRIDFSSETDTSVIPRSAAQSLLKLRRSEDEALMLAGSSDGTSDWSVSDALLIESFVDGAPWSTIQLGSKEPLLNGNGSNIPFFGPARKEFDGLEINIGSLVPPGRDTVLKFSVITLDDVASVSDLYVLRKAVDLP